MKSMEHLENGTRVVAVVSEQLANELAELKNG
ncbi:MAG: hypothetical protein RLZZ508_955, partial [Actinomycetota bacterium]